MRVVGGRLKGVRLAGPKGDAIRPTSDRVREAVFNILSHSIDGGEPAGLRVLDLFAGTGALGCEALSRGAAFCLFVEDDANARAIVRRNVEALALTGVTKIFRRDATKLGEVGRIAPFDLCFCDPPYGRGLGEKALAAAAAGGWLVPGAIAVLEERAGVEVEPPDGFELLDERRYGDTQVAWLKWQGA